MNLHSTILLLMGHFLCSNLLSADLMDLISEATCAARCFALFSQSLTGQDKLFLQQHPELTQPHCINQKGACSLCLDVCQWPRAQTVQCNETCKDYIKTAERVNILNAEQTCLDACTFARELYTRLDQFNRGQLAPHCPRPESWPPVCGPHCRTDADCPSKGLHKCCPTTVCAASSNAPANNSWTQICTPGILTSSGVPFVPARPSVKQLDSVIANTSSSQPAQETHQLELDWLNYYNITRAKPNGWGPNLYPAVFLIQLRLFHDPSASITFEDPNQPDARDSNVIDPTLFADRLFDEWRSLVWTTKLGAVLSDLRPGTWYQFRLLAISSAGHGGWGEPSRPIKILTRPIPPSSPRNLTEARSRISESVVDVTIQWQPPLAGNLPLKKYQITWRRYYGFNGGDRGSFTEYEANVPGDKTIYLIENLEPATSYKIEVKAVSVFEGKELPSHPVSLYITTLPIPDRTVARNNIQLLSPNETCRCDLSPFQPIKIGEAFYEEKQLKALLSLRAENGQLQRNKQYTIEWGPRVCIETRYSQGQPAYLNHKKIAYGYEVVQLELTHLLFQCHYKVTVSEYSTKQPTTQQRPRFWQACFCTPPCHTVTVRTGPAPINCTNTASFGSMEPMKLTYKLLDPKDPIPKANNFYILQMEQTGHELAPRLTSASSTHYDAMVNWKLSGEGTHNAFETRRRFRALPNHREQEKTDPGVRGIRVTWGPRVYEPVAEESYHNGLKPYLDPERAQSKVVDPRHSSLILRRLQPNTLYIVHVQMISEDTDGPVSTIFFSIPTHSQPQIQNVSMRCKWSNRWVLLCQLLVILLHVTIAR
ncbi:anosmin-1 [Clonorchis sinensis]|uniref:Anosmin-1 n=1 Tax=Clonorchis sinensis TaxID=79923 RepID=G7YFS9_CLOSI|nr:anosmin-1 [Clonorchis sinensis]